PSLRLACCQCCGRATFGYQILRREQLLRLKALTSAADSRVPSARGKDQAAAATIPKVTGESSGCSGNPESDRRIKRLQRQSRKRQANQAAAAAIPKATGKSSGCSGNPESDRQIKRLQRQSRKRQANQAAAAATLDGQGKCSAVVHPWTVEAWLAQLPAVDWAAGRSQSGVLWSKDVISSAAHCSCTTKVLLLIGCLPLASLVKGKIDLARIPVASSDAANENVLTAPTPRPQNQAKTSSPWRPRIKQPRIPPPRYDVVEPTVNKNAVVIRPMAGEGVAAPAMKGKRAMSDSRQVRSGGIGDPHPAGVPDEGAEVSDIVRGGQLVHPLGVAEVFVPRLVEVRAEGDVMLRGLLSYATEGAGVLTEVQTFLEKHLTLVENGNTRSSAAVEQRAVGEAVNALAAPVHTDIQRNVVSARDGGLEAPPDVEGGRGGRVRTCDGTANAALKLVQPLTGGLLLQHASPDETRVCDTGPDDAGINPTDRSRREAPSRPDGSAQLGKAAFCPTDDVIKVLRPAQVMPHGLTSAPIAGWTTPEQQVEDDLPRSDVGGKIVLLEGVFPLRGETHVGVFTEEPGADLLDASRAGVEGSVAPAGRRWSGTLNDQRREGGRAGVPGDGHQVSQRELELGFVLEGEDDAAVGVSNRLDFDVEGVVFPEEVINHADRCFHLGGGQRTASRAHADFKFRLRRHFGVRASIGLLWPLGVQRGVGTLVWLLPFPLRASRGFIIAPATVDDLEARNRVAINEEERSKGDSLHHGGGEDSQAGLAREIIVNNQNNGGQHDGGGAACGHRVGEDHVAGLREPSRQQAGKQAGQARGNHASSIADLERYKAREPWQRTLVAISRELMQQTTRISSGVTLSISSCALLLIVMLRPRSSLAASILGAMKQPDERPQPNGDFGADHRRPVSAAAASYLLACYSFVLLHSVVLVALDAIMMKRGCSGLLGASFFVLAATLALLPACALLAASQPRSRGRRALIGLCCLWGLVLLGDAVWVCLVFPWLASACVGTALIGTVAIGLVCCPASLVAFVILHGWLAGQALANASGSVAITAAAAATFNRQSTPFVPVLALAPLFSSELPACAAADAADFLRLEDFDLRFFDCRLDCLPTASSFAEASAVFFCRLLLPPLDSDFWLASPVDGGVADPAAGANPSDLKFNRILRPPPPLTADDADGPAQVGSGGVDAAGTAAVTTCGFCGDRIGRILIFSRLAGVDTAAGDGCSSSWDGVKVAADVAAAAIARRFSFRSNFNGFFGEYFAATLHFNAAFDSRGGGRNSSTGGSGSGDSATILSSVGGAASTSSLAKLSSPSRSQLNVSTASVADWTIWRARQASDGADRSPPEPEDEDEVDKDLAPGSMCSTGGGGASSCTLLTPAVPDVSRDSVALSIAFTSSSTKVDEGPVDGGHWSDEADGGADDPVETDAMDTTAGAATIDDRAAAAGLGQHRSTEAGGGASSDGDGDGAGDSTGGGRSSALSQQTASSVRLIAACISVIGAVAVGGSGGWNCAGRGRKRVWRGGQTRRRRRRELQRRAAAEKIGRVAKRIAQSHRGSQHRAGCWRVQRVILRRPRRLLLLLLRFCRRRYMLLFALLLFDNPCCQIWLRCQPRWRRSRSRRGSRVSFGFWPGMEHREEIVQHQGLAAGYNAAAAAVVFIVGCTVVRSDFVSFVSMGMAGRSEVQQSRKAVAHSVEATWAVDAAEADCSDSGCSTHGSGLVGRSRSVSDSTRLQ
uniref:Peptidase S1 domain-containing protein n=1 Tax=Macrostomum lignano TaxID=282301 RepID=A0A1I8JA38_9PLAT